MEEATKATAPIFAPRPLPVRPVLGSETHYPVARIFCAGRNYAAHAAEMGDTTPREEPFWFTKSCFALAPSGSTLPYPPGTRDFQHEVELVVALGAGGGPCAYGCGLDMTRRDLQARAKEGRKPWDAAKDFEGGAVIGPLVHYAPGEDAQIALTVNGSLRQVARLSEMIWGVAALLTHLDGLYRLGPGDIVMTGTPAGVGPVLPGDHILGRIAGLPDVALRIGADDGG